MRTKSLVTVVLLAATLILAGCSQTATDESAQPETNTADAPTSQAVYTVERVSAAPDWSSIPQLDIDNQQWLDPVDITAHAQLCYDESAFYVRMWAEEANIRAEYPASDLLASTYLDSCLEFFMMPVENDPRYLNFEFNPNCACGVEIGTEKVGRTRLVRADNPYNAVSTITDEGWEITYTIPFELIRTLYPDFSPETGDKIAANFYKCGNLTVQKHYISWNPVDSETPNFHVPESFGTLILG